MKTQASKIKALSITLLALFHTGCGAENNEISIPSVPEISPPAANPAAPGGVQTNPAPSNAEARPAENGSPPSSCSKPALSAKKTADIRYQSISGVDPKFHSLDIYMPAVANPCEGVPVVIWVHGGAWMIGDKSNLDSQVKAKHFNAMGFAFVSVNYRLSPEVRDESQLNPDRIKFPDHPNDVGAAVAWVHKNIRTHGGNPEKLAVLGHSAGAHLAALVALDQRYIERTHTTWNPKALRCLGSYDTEAYNINEFMPTAVGMQRLFYRNAFGDLPAMWSAASPINFIKDYGMAIQLAKRGDAGRHAQLENFKKALEEKKNSVSVIDAQSLSHEEVNRLIGSTGDQIMTPFVSKFLSETCFPK
ncbi:MAG: hypothetical protein RI932_410 [Pseudomonadota bacterium]|jgi:arylformamidase